LARDLDAVQAVEVLDVPRAPEQLEPRVLTRDRRVLLQDQVVVAAATDGETFPHQLDGVPPFGAGQLEHCHRRPSRCVRWIVPATLTARLTAASRCRRSDICVTSVKRRSYATAIALRRSACDRTQQ